MNFKDYSFFHTKEWAEVLVDTYKFTPSYFCYFSNDKITSIIPALLIKSWVTGSRLVSLPFSDYCAPLLSSESESIELYDYILEYCASEQLKFVEFKTLDNYYPPNTLLFRKDYRHTLKIYTPENELYKSFSENTRRNIKKAVKEGLSLDIRNDENGISDFYKMNCVTRKKHGLPPQPLSFFKNILNAIIKKELGDIIFAAHNNNVIAGALYLKFHKKIIYKYGASYPEFNDLRGNHFVMWEAIKKYSSEGFMEFDFGRTEFYHDGLRRFKLGWCTDESYIYTSRIDSNKIAYPSEIKTRGFHNTIFNRSPLFLLKIIGRLIYRHIG